MTTNKRFTARCWPDWRPDHTLLGGVIALLVLLLVLPAALQAQHIDTMALRTHTRFLSSDQLAGRGTGSSGEHAAAQYIETQLQTLGVRPAASGFLLPVPLHAATIDSARITLSGSADSSSYTLDDFAVNAGGQQALRDFSGSVLFVGTADHARQVPDADLAGRVIVLLGTLGAEAVTLVPRWLGAGVQGVIMLVPDSAQFQLFSRSRGTVRYYIAAPVDEPVWQSALPSIVAGPRLSRALVGHLGEQLNCLIYNCVGLARRQPFRPIPIDKQLRFRAHANDRALRTNNVLGIIPGSDPKLRGQYVIYTAHYDHLGISTPDARGDSIYNGFSDNAAGVAMLLAIAQELIRNPPPRSVAFLFLTGEERGLLGSTWYASNPALPLDSTVAVINLDAGAPSAPPLEWRVAGGTNSPLGLLAQTVAQQHQWRAEPSAASPNSDYWPFHSRGVPAVFIIPGMRWEGVTSAQRDSLRARWDRYHQANDEWHPQFPFAGLQRYALFALELGRAAARLPYTRP